MNLLNLFHKHKPQRRQGLILFVLLVISACQPAQSASTSTQSNPTQIPIIEPTPIESVVIPLPTVTESPIATQPVATEAASALTPNGPWLAYLRDGLTTVNQDGTGRTVQENPECSLDDGVGIHENPLNILAIFPRTVYVVQPEAMWTLISREWPTCHTDFTGDETGGLLAAIHHSTTDAIPELRIYELPGGKIRDQFPLLKCSDQTNSCNFGEGAGPNLEWSPNGRYLAFSAIWDGPSSDLYVYDTEDGKTRQLTSGPDHIGSIWWSPDGSQIIMGEIPFENMYPGLPSSLWAVSVRDNEIRLLYSRENPYPQGLIGWLDESRFIIYDGTNLINALDLPANNIRLVDMDSGEITTLFSGSFVAAEIDQAHETLAFYAYDPDPREGYEGQGIYLVSPSNLTIRYVEGAHQLGWDNEAGLFVTSDPCEDDPRGRKAFNYRREWKCIYHEWPPESLSSPDGKWQISLQDGFWLNANDQQPVQVSEETPTQIIWCPDSAGLFFVANQTLYYASLPELDIKIVDEYPGGDSIFYQWVGDN